MPKAAEGSSRIYPTIRLNGPPAARIELFQRRLPGNLSRLMQKVNLGMIGGGTVGSGVFHALDQNGSLMAARLGVEIAFRKIAVKAFDEPRPYPVPRSLMTTDWQEVVNDPETHII